MAVKIRNDIYTSSIRLNFFPYFLFIHNFLFLNFVFRFMWFIWHMNPVSCVWKTTTTKNTFFWTVCAFGNRYRDKSTHITSGYEKGCFFLLPSPWYSVCCLHSHTLPSFMGFDDIESATQINHHLTFQIHFLFCCRRRHPSEWKNVWKNKAFHLVTLYNIDKILSKMIEFDEYVLYAGENAFNFLSFSFYRKKKMENENKGNFFFRFLIVL